MNWRRKNRTAVLALAALLVLTGHSASGEPVASATGKKKNPYRAFPHSAAMKVDLVAATGPDDPMYIRLPPDADKRGWDLMLEGKKTWWAKGGHRLGKDEPYEHDYEFTWDVFTWNIPVWNSVLQPFAGKPDLQYLEIGTSEGRATFWMLENILTHPTSRATGIDPFMIEGHEERLLANREAYGQPEKLRIIKGFSQDVLPDLEPNSFDIIYIDGSHLAGDVLIDAVYTWRLLKDGGIVIHDDYMWEYGKRTSSELRPLVVIDAFITGLRNDVEVLHRGNQLILRKRKVDFPDFCWNRDPCSRVGDHFFAWKSERLFEIGKDEPIPLTKVEVQVLMDMLRARRFGAEDDRILAGDVAALRAKHPKEFERLRVLLDLKV